MAEQTGNGNNAAELWFRWQEAVRNIVEPRRGAGRISSQDYRDLHSALVKACQNRDEADAELSDDLQQVKRIASPWVNYESLATADRRFLSDILNQAERINATLRKNAGGPARKTRAPGKRAVSPLAWILAFGVGLGAGLFLLAGDTAGDLPFRYDLQRAMLRTRYMLGRFNFLQIFGAVTIFVLLVVGPLMYKTKKS